MSFGQVFNELSIHIIYQLTYILYHFKANSLYNILNNLETQTGLVRDMHMYEPSLNWAEHLCTHKWVI